MNNDILEVWKEIPGYEGSYECSNLGNIRSLTRIVSNGRKIVGKNRSPVKDRKGYLRFSMSNGNAKKMIRVHRAVALTFIGDGGGKDQVNHIDGVKTNNRVENLEWTTCKENHEHAVRMNLNAKGERKRNAKLTAQQAMDIFELKEWGLGAIAIHKELGTPIQPTASVYYGRGWRHLDPLRQTG